MGKSLQAQLEEFPLVADLGVITVPPDYEHETQLSSFHTKYSKLCRIREGFTDEKFATVSHKLKPNEQLHVRAYAGIHLDKCLPVIRTLQGVHTGAQGLTLVWELKQDMLPYLWAYASFDEKDHLAIDRKAQATVRGQNLAQGEEWYTLEIPYLYRRLKDNNQFVIGHNDGMDSIRNAFFVFNEVRS